MSAFTARLRSLSAKEQWLIAEGVATMALVALAVGFLPFHRVASLAREPRRMSPNERDRAREISAVRWAVSACSRRVPWRAKCLEQAFAAQWMLRRRGVPAVIHYGIAKEPDGLVAHAWVRVGSADVIGCENACQFTEIARFPCLDSR